LSERPIAALAFGAVLSAPAAQAREYGRCVKVAKKGRRADESRQTVDEKTNATTSLAIAVCAGGTDVG